MFVVKVGGSILEKFENVAKDLAQYERFVLVHGIGPQVDELTRKILGKEPRWVTSIKGIKSRYTDKETLDIFVMMSQAMNKQLVVQLRKQGINAIGLAGCDGGLIQAKRKERIKVVEDGRKMFLDGDFTGKIVSVNAPLLQNLLDHGYFPVISPLAISENNELLNINGDRAAAFFAKELKAEQLLNLSNIDGVLKSLETKEVIPEIQLNEIENYMQKVSGGMVMKLYGAKEVFFQYLQV